MPLSAVVVRSQGRSKLYAYINTKNCRFCTSPIHKKFVKVMCILRFQLEPTMNE